jgi:hypothetical protein
MHKHVPFVFFFRFLFVTCVVFLVFGFGFLFFLICAAGSFFWGCFFSSPLVAGSCVRACVAVCFFFCAPWFYLLSWDVDDLDRAFACLKTGFGGDPFCSVLVESCLIFFCLLLLVQETNKKPRVFLTIT